MRDLGHTQARAIGDAERGLVLQARCSFEQPRRFLYAEHIRQLVMIAGDHQGTRQIPALQRHQKQEPQRRDRTVDGGRPYAVLMLVELEAADILRRRGVGRAPEECREAPDMTNVVLPRVEPRPRMSMSCCMRWRSGEIGALIDGVSMASSSR